MRLTLTISRDFLTNLGLDASILSHWIGDERTGALCREVIETFLLSFTEDGQPGEGVRVSLSASPIEAQAWTVVLEGEREEVLGLVREVMGEAGFGLDWPGS